MSVANREQARLFGWIGSLCLLLIIPIKAIRFLSEESGRTLLVGIAPSLLGPAGLLFLILSSSGRLSRLPLLDLALLVAGIALGLEFAQLLPRPEVLAWLFYTFDWLDVVASVLSLMVGYSVASWVLNKKLPERRS